MTVEDLLALNAVLNGTSAVLLVAGFAAIRRKRVMLHRNLMLVAFCVSSVFLVSYVVHKIAVGTHRFPDVWMRPVYLTILATHTFLAALIVPLALTTLTLGLKRRHPRHERLARWTLPIWLYVSVTGVVIYFLLYKLYPSPPS